MKPTSFLILCASLTFATNASAQHNDKKSFGLNGDVKRITSYYMDDTMEPSGEKEIAEFDPSGKMTSHKLLYPDGNTKNYTEATYDKKGNLTDEHTWNYEHGFKETLRRFKHDRNGNISVSAQYDNGKLTEQNGLLFLSSTAFSDCTFSITQRWLFTTFRLFCVCCNEYTSCNCCSDNTGNVRAHSVHEQEVTRVILKTDLVGNTGSHWNCRNTC